MLINLSPGSFSITTEGISNKNNNRAKYFMKIISDMIDVDYSTVR